MKYTNQPKAYIILLLISFCLFPSIIQAQKTTSNTRVGISIRPSMYKDYSQFEAHQVYDLAPTLIFERRLNESFSIRLNLQYRSWQKEFVQQRFHIPRNRYEIHRTYKVLAPAIFISWQKPILSKKLKANPYINLGFSQHFQIYRQNRYPNLINISESEGFLVRQTQVILGLGMNFPINKKWSAFLEPQFAKSINSLSSRYNFDLGLMVGSTIAL